MILSLFYKEWLKTRWMVIFSLIIGVGAILYLFIELNSNIINSGGKANYIYNWFTMGGRDHFAILQNLPLIFAILIGVSQYYPEVSGKRIKLTLHLPSHNTTLLYLMVMYGFLVITSIFMLMLALYYSVELSVFPAQIGAMSLNAITPWMLKGLIAYFFVSFVAMEPTLKFRFVYSVAIVLFFTAIIHKSANYPLLLTTLLVSSLSILYSAKRFIIGEN